MNYFYKEKLIKILIVLLTLFNIILLFIFWKKIFQPSYNNSFVKTDNRPKFEKIRDFLIKEIHVNPRSIENLSLNFSKHFSEMKVLDEQLRTNRENLYSEIFKQQSDIKKIEQILIELTSIEEQRKRKKADHFLELKTLFDPEQLKEFKKHLKIKENNVKKTTKKN